MERDRLMNENGVALVVALMILLVMTLIGFSSISTTTFESKIAGNERVGTDAFYVAEAGLQVGFDKVANSDLTAIGVQSLGTDSSYWSGSPADKGSPKPIYYLGVYKKEASDLTWGYKLYQVDATGESFGSTKQIEAQVTKGPLLLSTEYNP